MEWGTPVLWGRFLLFCVPQSVETKETNPTRPGSPTPCKQALSPTKKKWIFCLVVTSFIIKRDSLHFHVIVVHWRQRNVEKGDVRAKLLFCLSKPNFAVLVAVVGWTSGLIMSRLVASKKLETGNNAYFSSNSWLYYVFFALSRVWCSKPLKH